MMDESRYQRLADLALRSIENMLDDVDAEVVDIERAGDVVTLTFADRKKAVINTQRPTRQIWMAANSRAWHFSYDVARAVWIDDKDPATELYATLSRILREAADVTLTF